MTLPLELDLLPEKIVSSDLRFLVLALLLPLISDILLTETSLLLILSIVVL